MEPALTASDSCRFCRFWVHDPELDELLLGTCRRYAPSPLTKRLMEFDTEAELVTFWPTTAYNDRCGDFQPQPPPCPHP